MGKYVSLQDSYKSITEAFVHAGARIQTKVKVKWIYSGDLTEQNVKEVLGDVDGILVAPGFGDRGLEGKILACKYARENNVPLLGICLGMQMMVIEFARNVLGLKDAESAETNHATPNPVISLMDEQKNVAYKGGTMRLGNWKCDLKEGSKIKEIYKNNTIQERHRHRYEFNNDYYDEFEKAGLVLSGVNPDTSLVETVEYPNHPFYIGVQFHPEYKSTVATPHPLFKAFLEASLNFKNHKK